MSDCNVHDGWRFDLACTCPAERKWARKAMLTDSLEKLMQTPPVKPQVKKGVK